MEVNGPPLADGGRRDWPQCLLEVPSVFLSSTQARLLNGHVLSFPVQVAAGRSQCEHAAQTWLDGSDGGCYKPQFKVSVSVCMRYLKYRNPKC